MKWLWLCWLVFCLCLMKLPLSIDGSVIFDIELKLSIPDENVTWTKTGARYYCHCRNECAARVSCKAVTIYNISSKLECRFSAQEIRVGHLKRNGSAVTLFPIRDGHTSCPTELKRFPGVGCLKMFNPKLNYTQAKVFCVERNTTLFVADTPQHFQRLTADYIPTVPGPYTTKNNAWLGIYDDVWYGGRQPMNLEWFAGEPSSAKEQCGKLLANGVFDCSCSDVFNFVLCEKKSWNASP